MDCLVIDQIVYSLNVGNSARNIKQVLTPYKVIKIGRKYFTVRRCDDDNGWTDTQFHIDGWHEKSNYTPNSALYISEQEWHEEEEVLRICRDIEKAFDYGGNHKKIPLESLRVIAAIIDQLR